MDKCTTLERISLKGAVLGIEHGDVKPLSQDTLINMVRGHTKLQWFRSDLTAENVTMLKKERRNVTFVTDE